MNNFKYEIIEIKEIKSNIKEYRNKLDQKITDAATEVKEIKIIAYAESFEWIIRSIDKVATEEDNYAANSLYKAWLKAKGNMQRMLSIIYELDESGKAFVLSKNQTSS